jgi:GNAT superfamily N-acetyltransferase
MSFEILTLSADLVPEVAGADGGQGWRREVDHWERCLEDHLKGQSVAVIARDYSGALGYARLLWRSQYPGFWDIDAPEIHDLRVAARRRRCGVATAVITHFERLAISAGRRVIGLGVGLYADYGAAQRLYPKLGYRPDGKGVTYGNVTVAPGADVKADDDLVLWLVKDLIGYKV